MPFSWCIMVCIFPQLYSIICTPCFRPRRFPRAPPFLVLFFFRCRPTPAHAVTAFTDFHGEPFVQGPTPGGADSPQPPPAPAPAAAAASTSQDAVSPEEYDSGIENGLPGAAAAVAAASTGFADDSSGSAPSSGAGLAEGSTGGTTNGAAQSSGNSEAGTGGQGGTGWSFARVTAMNGHFPTLNPSPAKAGGSVSTIMSNSKQTAGAWGGSTATTATASSTAVHGGRSGGGGAGAWGATANDPSRGTAIDAAGESRTLVGREGGATQAGVRDTDDTPNSTGKKKGRKGKAVSLFSNAGVRGGAR